MNNHTATALFEGLIFSYLDCVSDVLADLFGIHPLLPFQPIICLATRVIFSESNFGYGLLVIWHPSDLGRKSKFLSIAEEVLNGPLSVCSSRMTFLRSPNLASSKSYILMHIIQADAMVMNFCAGEFQMPFFLPRVPFPDVHTHTSLRHT